MLKTSVKYCTKVTHLSLPTILIQCPFLILEQSLSSTNQTTSHWSTSRCHSSPTINPLVNATHHWLHLTIFNTTQQFTSLSFFIFYFYLFIYLFIVILHRGRQPHYFLATSIIGGSFFFFFFPFTATWLYWFGFSNGLWVMCGWVCGLWWMARMFCRYWWWLGCGFWWVAEMVCGSDCCGLQWVVGHLYIYIYIYLFPFQ